MRRSLAAFLALMLHAATCAADDWRTVKIDTLGSTIELPGEPKIDDKDVDLDGKQVAKMRTHMVQSGSTVFDVTVSVYPKDYIDQSAMAQSLDNTRDYLVDSWSGKLLSEAKANVSGHPARDVVLDAMGMDMRTRIVFIGDQQFLITAITPKSATPSADVERYLASFKPAGSAAADKTDAKQ